jgi:hypothetical protein
MSNPRLPAEMLDHVVDHLHDTEDALKSCCLVSKSWVPRTRKHLFAVVEFPTENILQSWRETFRDPSTSPACYTKTLSVGCSEALVPADEFEDSWIRGFSRIVHLEVGSQERFDDVFWGFVPLHGLSPVIKSLHMTVPDVPTPFIFDLIFSLPLLEDLTMVVSDEDSIGGNGRFDWLPAATQPPSPPAFTGSLELSLMGEMEYIITPLLSLQGGIHFRKLVVTWFNEYDLLTTAVLMEACSHTLEYLDVACDTDCAFIRHLCPYQ